MTWASSFLMVVLGEIAELAPREARWPSGTGSRWPPMTGGVGPDEAEVLAHGGAMVTMMIAVPLG